MTPLAGQEVVAGGDFNLVMNVPLDKRGGLPRTHEKARRLLIEWCDTAEMIDVWRVKHPGVFDYTWRSWSAPYVYCRLDFFIISQSLCNAVTSCEIKNSYASDHRAVKLVISHGVKSRGPGFWKFNSALLSDKKYTSLIHKTILDTIMDNKGATPTLLFDTIKCRVRGATIKYSSYKKKTNNINLQDWNTKLSTLQEALPNIINPTEIEQAHEDIQLLNMKIEAALSDITRGSALRSRVQHYEEGERCSKFFYNLEKSNYNSKTLTRLNTDMGELNSPTEILTEQVNFYSRLYTSTSSKHDPGVREGLYGDFFLKDHLMLETDQQQGLVCDITEGEVFNILKTFADNKSPGTDGLSKEFYVFFWESVKLPLLESFKYSLETGSLSMDQRRGIITLIPKKGKDSTRLKNWRPLTLLNTDYKILAKLFAYRIKGLLESIIHNDQTGFVSSRYIGTNVNRILNAIEYCELNDIEAMLISIDFEKAFDSMEWDFVFRSMRYYGFPDKFVNWIKLLYNDIESCIINDGNISRFFTPSRGVRQGCPASPYLYIIGAEVLACFIRASISIPCIPISQSHSAVSMYADDTTIITDRGQNVINSLFTILDNFSVVSGLKVNKEKTQVMPIGSNITQCYGIENTCDTLHILGIDIIQDRRRIITSNFDPILTKIKSCLNIWSQRHLSLFGKIEVVKTLAISRLVYALTLLPSPSRDYLYQIEKVLLQFIWNNKPAKIRSGILKSTKNFGGADMPDISLKNACLKIGWLGRVDSMSGSWKDFFVNTLPITDMEYFLRCNIKHSDLELGFKDGSFWSDVMYNWCDFNYRNIDYLNQNDTILSSNIWLNSNILINKKTVMWKSWYDKDIRYINDLVCVKQNRFYNWVELQDKYHVKGNYLNLMSLLSAIPRRWCNTLFKFGPVTQVEILSCNELVDIVLKNPKPSGTLYKKLVNDRNDQPYDRYEKWFSEIGYEPFETELDWYVHIHDCYLCTPSRALRSFMYKFHMRDLATGTKLLKMKLVNSPSCIKCAKFDETVQHMFWECEMIQSLWSKLHLWLAKIYGHTITFSKESVLLYVFDEEIDTAMYYVLILVYTLTKQIIYEGKNDLNLNYLHAVKAIKECEILERNAATAKGALQKHFNKWGNLYSAAK